MKIGIFGGTFDPPHNGHLNLAEEALKQFNLEIVLWVLTPNPPHKKERKLTAIGHRIDMVNAAIFPNKNFLEICKVYYDYFYDFVFPRKPFFT